MTPQESTTDQDKSDLNDVEPFAGPDWLTQDGFDVLMRTITAGLPTDWLEEARFDHGRVLVKSALTGEKIECDWSTWNQPDHSFGVSFKIADADEPHEDDGGPSFLTAMVEALCKGTENVAGS